MASRRLLSPLALVALVVCGCSLLRRPEPTPSPAATPAASPTPGVVTIDPGPYQSTTFVPLSPRCQTRRIPVMMYHEVVPDRRHKVVNWDCTVDELKEHLDYLEQEGAHFLTLEQLHRHLTRGDEVPEKSIVLTFDDNYQGFYDNAYPLLKARKIPAAIFVTTGPVGQKMGAHPHMSWETLKQLESEGLVTIAAHTVSHPGEFELKSLEIQQTELQESKDTLERELGHPVPYLAYPEGRGDEQTFAIAQQLGYTMAFTIDNGPAEQSPGILRINRYVHTRLKKAWEECQEIAATGPAAVVQVPLVDSPVTLTVGTFDGVRLALVKGGKPVSARAVETGRKSVGEFVRDVSGAVAGMNGTFFVNADLRSVDSALIGPCRTQLEGQFIPDPDPIRLQRVWNRPLIVWGERSIAIVPFNPLAFNEESALLALVPDMTDVFLAGAWIVHDGVARTKKEIGFAARDFNDPRKRAFFGLTEKGEVVLGATRDVVTTEMMARGAAAAGVREAVLMDSGFSTSIVFDGKIIATGHTAKDLPSRPVPHAILVRGTVQPPSDPETLKVFETADTAVGAVDAIKAQADAPVGAVAAGADDGKKRRRRRR